MSKEFSWILIIFDKSKIFFEFFTKVFMRLLLAICNAKTSFQRNQKWIAILIRISEILN